MPKGVKGFQKGVATPGAGRPGYEFESRQLKQMRELLDKYLAVAERILNDQERANDHKKIQLLSADMRKVLDKLHPSKTESKEEKVVKLPKPLLSYLDQQTKDLKKLE